MIGYLLSQQNKAGRVIPDCSREDLARRLDVSRAALFRELAFLQSQGLLTLADREIVIVDQAGLEHILYQPSGSK